MAMKELARIELAERQVLEACEQYVAARIDRETEEARASWPEAMKGAVVTVVVSKRRSPRKAKAAP